MGTVIRNATADDVPGLLCVEGSSYPEPWDEDTFRNFLAQGSTVCLLAEDTDDAAHANAEVVGYALGTVALSTSQLLSIAVLPTRRGEHLAARLLRELISRASDSGASSMRLEVRSTNHPARALYQSFGFERVALRPRYYPDDDALIMQLAF
jgi:ribosomal-protein-alanine N-acetyltransferase